MMKIQNILRSLIALIVVLTFVSGTSVYAEDIKSRMKSRLPAIAALKAKGIIGESNKGYLAFVGSTQEKAGLVSAENSDRKTVYSAIANKQNTSPASVGSLRAKSIAKNAKPGEWLQDNSGKWYKK